MGHQPKFSMLPLQRKINAERLHLSKDSTLIIRGSNVSIQDLDLDGTLTAEAGQYATITIDGARIKNRGWAWQPVKKGPAKRPPSEIEAMRLILT